MKPLVTRINGRFAPKAKTSDSQPQAPGPIPGAAAQPNHAPDVGVSASASQTPPTPSQTPPTPAQAAAEALAPATSAKRRRGRPSNAELAARGINPQPQRQHVNGDALGPGAMPGQPQPDSYAAMGKTLASGFIGAMCAIFNSDEWKPKNESEFTDLSSAATTYCRSKRIPDLPPGFVLLAAVAMYSLPRLAMPETKSKLQAFQRKLRGATNSSGEISPVAPVVAH